MPIDTISDTARWMAYARAMESDRPDALFHDPLARQLAGEAGASISREIGDAEMIARGIAVRTAVMDEMILQKVTRDGVELVLNLAAGLDARPWRLTLPPTLRWVDVDLREVLDYKTRVIGAQRAACKYESLDADITEPGARARVFARCGQSQKALVVTEGVLVYLSSAQVGALARDLHDQLSFSWWITDLTGPRALEMLQRVWGTKLRGVKFQFGPADSVEFFRRLGWRELSFRSSQQETRRLRRGTPGTLLSRVMLLLSSAALREEFRRLSGVALFARDVVPGPDRASS